MTQELASSKYFNEEQVLAEPSTPIDRHDWTKGLTVICILCVLLGLWGLCSCVWGFSAILAPVDAAAEGQPLSYQAEQFKRQTEEIGDKYLSARLFQQIVKLGLAGAFLFGCFFLLSRNPAARSFVFATCGVAILYHFGGTVLHFLMFHEIAGVIKDASRSALQNSVHVQQQEELMSQLMGAVSFGASVITLGLFAVRGCFYAALMWYLSQPCVRVIYGEDPYLEFREMEAKMTAETAGAV